MFPVRRRHQRCLHTLLSSLLVGFACLRALRTHACPQEPSPVQMQEAFRRMPLRWWWNAVKVWQKAALDHSSVYILSVVGNWLGPLPQLSCIPVQQLSALWVYVFGAALEDLPSSYQACLYSTMPSDLKAEHCFLIFLHTSAVNKDFWCKMMDGSQSLWLLSVSVYSRILSSASKQPLLFCQGVIKSHHHRADSNWVLFKPFDVSRRSQNHKVITFSPRKIQPGDSS